MLNTKKSKIPIPAPVNFAEIKLEMNNLISIKRATTEDFHTVVQIGNISVYDAHKASCSAADMNDYLQKHYNDTAIKEELADPKNIYYIIYYDGMPAGFSKIVFNASHPNVEKENVTKLDRIYLLKEFQDKKLGYELLKFNIDLCKQNGQSGIWLFTWVGNSKAVNFYIRAGFKFIGSHMFKVSETHSNENHHMLLDLEATR